MKSERAERVERAAGGDVNAKAGGEHFSKIFLKRGASCKAVLKNTRGVC